MRACGCGSCQCQVSAEQDLADWRIWGYERAPFWQTSEWLQWAVELVQPMVLAESSALSANLVVLEKLPERAEVNLLKLLLCQP